MRKLKIKGHAHKSFLNNSEVASDSVSPPNSLLTEGCLNTAWTDADGIYMPTSLCVKDACHHHALGDMFTSLPVGAGADKYLWPLQSHVMWEWMLMHPLPLKIKVSGCYVILQCERGFSDRGLNPQSLLISELDKSSGDLPSLLWLQLINLLSGAVVHLTEISPLKASSSNFWALIRVHFLQGQWSLVFPLSDSDYDWRRLYRNVAHLPTLSKPKPAIHDVLTEWR